jgi:hypothetical protein
MRAIAVSKVRLGLLLLSGVATGSKPDFFVKFGMLNPLRALNVWAGEH